MENLLKKTEELREKILNAKNILDVDSLLNKKQGLEKIMSQSDFWSDKEKAVEISSQVENLEKETSKWLNLENEVTDLEKIIALANKEGDDSMYKDLNRQYDILEKKFSDLEFLLLFSEKYDKNNAVISIHAGTGGVDAQDFAQILSRMFFRFCEKKDWKVYLIENNYGQEAGIKSQVFKVTGTWAYGHLKSENGVHRLVRISPFDAESMRHTSFAKVEIIPDLPEAKEVEINESDLRVDVFKSSGPGGQGVNTTDSAVRVVHIPTKISASSQNERSQHQNKELALEVLKNKLYKLEEDKKAEEENRLKGRNDTATWGKQIRSYVMQPYKMAKDHRTDYSTDDIDSVLDGDLDKFIEAYLKSLKDKKK